MVMKWTSQYSLFCEFTNLLCVESLELKVDDEQPDLLAEEKLDFSGDRWLVLLLGEVWLGAGALNALFSLDSFLERRTGE